MDFVDYIIKTEKYIEQFINNIYSCGKIKNYDQFKTRLYNQIRDWKTHTEYNETIYRQINETLNEICLADYLSNDIDCNEIIYEEIVGNSGRSIDFTAIYTNLTFFLDVKTIHPEDRDKWNNYQKMKDLGHINGHVHLYEDGLGGVSWHHMVSSRAKFIDYSLELEYKIREDRKSGYYFMVFCGNNFDWSIDELEDFVEYYLTGKFIGWDHLKDMSKYYMKAKGIEFDSTIANFSVLHRVEGEKEYKFYPFIRAPRVFRNYIDQ